jgi:pyruvate kinase
LKQIKQEIARVIQGELKSKKESTYLIQKISLPAMTEKTLLMLFLPLNKKVDWLALSFVKTPQDLKTYKMEHSDYKIPIIAKIEMPEALENIDKIVAYCDA